MAAPAILPTTPPTTTGVDGVLEEVVPLPLPGVAVPVAAVPVLVADPPAIPPPALFVPVEDEELGE